MSKVLGLDVSTKTIGISLFDESGKLILLTHVTPKVKNVDKLSDIEVLIKKAQVFEEEFLEKNTNFLFKTLIEQNYAPSNSIVIFNILKQHSNKIINWILPSKTTNFKFLKQIEKDNNLINLIIIEIIKNYNCKKLFVFTLDELRIQPCDINLNNLIKFFTPIK